MAIAHLRNIGTYASRAIRHSFDSIWPQGIRGPDTPFLRG